MPEHDRLVRAELAAPDEIDEPRHGAPGVHRIEEDPFVAGRELDRLALRLPQHRVAAADVRVVRHHLSRWDGRLDADASGESGGDFRDRGLQLFPGAVDRNAGELCLETEGLGAYAKPGLGPERAAREDDAIDAEPERVELSLQLLEGSDESGSADLVGRANGNQIGPVTFGRLRRHDLSACLLEAVLAGEDDPRAEQLAAKQAARSDRPRVAAQPAPASPSARPRGGGCLPGMV